MYALNLADDGRILSATYPQYAPADAVIVDDLPDGNVHEYRYVDGEYVHDPLPAPDQSRVIAPRNIMAGEYITIDGVLYLATMAIPDGEPVIVGQNATVTTIEEQLMQLKGE